MKERIKELITTIPTDTSGRWVYIGDMEKFAELIVEECCEVTNRTILKSSGVNPSTFNGTVNTVEEIKKHFGI
jgi:hypothetical protein